MTIKEIIKNRKSLSFNQELKLIDILAYKCGKETKEQIKQLIRNKFYSSFQGKSFAEDFNITGVDVTYSGSKSMAEIRKELLK